MLTASRSEVRDGRGNNEEGVYKGGAFPRRSLVCITHWQVCIQEANEDVLLQNLKCNCWFDQMTMSLNDPGESKNQAYSMEKIISHNHPGLNILKKKVASDATQNPRNSQNPRNPQNPQNPRNPQNP